ncbi:hypothetical protein CDD80_1498 [Ophiocordyceps camponoti-rufipedis]|uniref:Protein-serine/threonine kinase n=1 Tax=Ophiocordyceps camponoti-rufipedis TaxID=2004952 RepID=A0A2C5ZAQ1_9HYPO|nr:hypothetical protein CDD80_1498 [Ophiocordyceps camponoti-rufipedis]
MLRLRRWPARTSILSASPTLHGRPPLSEKSLLSSANFTLSLLPIRLAHRIRALRNLPYIVVSNPNISRIYNNYLHSLSILLPYWHAAAQGRAISQLQDEIRFTNALAELVATHTDTIPILAKGFLECRRYISPYEVTRFLDDHLRARIGTRLVAEQHIALHFSSQPHFAPEASPTPCPEDPSYIGVIDTALRPAQTIQSCAGFVADICELRYGSRPQLHLDGEPDAILAFVPTHLEYMVTELLKNAFRATVETRSTEPVVVTVAPEPPVQQQADGASRMSSPPKFAPAQQGGNLRHDVMQPLDEDSPGVTIRIRDRGGGIPPDVLPNIWSYSFTTFSEQNDFPGSRSGGADGLGAISSAGVGGSSIAGLGYGLPLSRAYAEYFGGGIAVQSLYGWGTDVYLRLNGVGAVDKCRRAIA